MPRWVWRVLVAAGFGPLVYLAWGTWSDGLGANPIEVITDETGTWTLRFLVATLAVTPVRRLTGLAWIAPWRRPLGLFAFLYGTAHLITYVWLDQFFDLAAIVRDVARRPFITAGAAAFVVMVPLAVTSTAGMIRRFGGVAWRRLHRLAYVAAVAGVLHYWWLVRADVRRPLTYGAIVAVLLGARGVWFVFDRARRQTRAASGL